MTRTSPPERTRPTMPEGYGLPATTDGMLGWPEVEQRLTVSKHYWLATVRPDGTPHTVPRWGVWLDGRFYYDGAPTTRHARNLERNPACTLTLESGTEVVIIEGTSRAVRADPGGLGARLAMAFEKYHPEYSPTPDSWSGEDGGGLRVIVPERALAWFAFPRDCTRFTFAPTDDGLATEPAVTPRVLVLGFDPYRVPGPWDPRPVADGIDEGRAEFAAHHLTAEFCLFGLDGSDDVDAVVTTALRARRWECVVIGGGVRHDLELFESVLDMVRRHAPQASIAFNATPADTYAAAARRIRVRTPARR